MSGGGTHVHGNLREDVRPRVGHFLAQFGVIHFENGGRVRPAHQDRVDRSFDHLRPVRRRGKGGR